ncbi:Imidazolonepropionase (Imidazolone-5-propionate hydrolase) [Agrobacterium tumefaciens]|nr:Imidazolonepropionase (Imidazolone-5-propionate hydrolase) [Agrobacterium tumefaciens]
MPGNKSANGTATGNATALWRNARLATFNPDMDGIGAVENAVIAVRNGRIAFAGPESDLPPIWRQPMTPPIAAAAGSPLP